MNNKELELITALGAEHIRATSAEFVIEAYRNVIKRYRDYILTAGGPDSGPKLIQECDEDIKMADKFRKEHMELVERIRITNE